MSIQTTFQRATQRVRAQGVTINPADFDRSARELYQKTTPHGEGGCFEKLSLADRLRCRCPACGRLVLAGPEIGLDVGLQMLAELQLRRRELGLDVEGA